MTVNTKLLNTHRRSAVIVGILFIIATAFLFIGEAVYGPVLNSPDYLEIAYPNRITVVLGMLLEFACVIAIPLIAVFMFPVLREHGEALALGYVGFRILEAVFFIVTEVNKLSLINVSQGYLETGASYFENLGRSIQSESAWVFLFYIVVFTIGGLMFHAVLYKSRLVPRFISAWGFIADVVLLIGVVLVMVELNTGPLENVWELIFATPIAVQEMVLAVWLIARGFNTSAIESGLARVDSKAEAYQASYS